MTFADEFQRLGKDGNRSKLTEMLVEGKRLLDGQSFHDHAAGAVGKAPELVRELLEHLNRSVEVRGRDVLNADVEILGEVAGEFNRTLAFAAKAQQREEFINDVIGGNERLVVGLVPM